VADIEMALMALNDGGMDLNNFAGKTAIRTVEKKSDREPVKTPAGRKPKRHVRSLAERELEKLIAKLKKQARKNIGLPARGGGSAEFRAKIQTELDRLLAEHDRKRKR
jgi:hypothetical protein